jgi:phosphopantothenoylcysteine decarboxylase/phosphopantothenate--cysteine ligase
MVLAPAMNDRMWHAAATRDNLAVLKKRGVTIVDVGSGELACGYSSEGRLADITEIAAVVESSVK